MRCERPSPAMCASGLTRNLAHAVAGELKDLSSSANDLLGPDASANVTVRTGLDEALEAYPPRARAALAQMSIIIAGVVSVAAVVVALMAALLLSRRERDIALERARGASAGSVSLRLLVESLLITV